MQSVKVDRLEIRLKGASPEVVRSAAAGLGNEVLGQLSKRSGPLGKEPAKTIYLGTLEGKGASDLRRTIAARIIESITS
jgi:hypothetical protein